MELIYLCMLYVSFLQRYDSLFLFLLIITVYVMVVTWLSVEMVDGGSLSTQEFEASTELNIPGNEMLEVKLAHFPDPFYSFKLEDDEEEWYDVTQDEHREIIRSDEGHSWCVICVYIQAWSCIYSCKPWSVIFYDFWLTLKPFVD